MLAAQHRGFIEDGVAVSILTASEGGIYGRFGYGPATRGRIVETDRRLTAFHPGAPDPGGVRQVEAELVAATDEVHDAFLDRGGRFRLRGGPDGACCDPTDRMPDAHVEIAALGSLYLGGHRAGTFARAGLMNVGPDRKIFRSGPTVPN